MTIPRVELATGTLAGRDLLDALLALFQMRADRFSTKASGGDAAQLAAVSFEDLRGDQPHWPVRLEVLPDGKLVGSIDGDLDPDIGAEVYAESLEHTVHALLLLLRAEATTNAMLRRPSADQTREDA